MKIGFSFGKCLRDIVTGKVAYEDVLVIMASTMMNSVDSVNGVIKSYMWHEDRLAGLDEERCQYFGQRLLQEGKLHQPRLQGIYRPPVEDRYIWMDLVPSEISDNESIRQAWENYRLLLTLTAEQLPSVDEAMEGAAITTLERE